ncbi:MAG TPA: CHASE domain-containing protein [Ignavibacteriaceae bacterium]|nr:CHASE domain-containing protein [Ignavibacteriaceae bacterium]
MAYKVNKPFEQAIKNLSSAFFKRGMVVAWLALIISLGITAYAWYSIKNAIDIETKERFDFQTNEIAEAIKKRMLDYELILRGGLGLFNASDEVTRVNWKDYVNTLRINENYPGILGIGFSKIIKKNEKEKHENEIKKTGFPEYKIWPAGERDIYTSIIFLEPFNELNQKALGYDMFSEEVRRKAMETARDYGRTSVSGKVFLVQDKGNEQTGFLMYMPVYDRKKLATLPAERRDALLGYVYSPFRMKDLMKGILQNQFYNIEIEIFDNRKISNDNLMFISSARNDSIKFGERNSLRKYKNLYINGRDWALRFTSQPGFDSNIDKQKPLIVLILGIVVSSLLFIISRNLSSIFLINKKLEQLLESTIEGIYGIDTKCRCTFINDSAAKMLGYEPEECHGRDMHELIHHHKLNGEIYPFYECPIIKSMENQKGVSIDSDVYWKKDGINFPVEYSSYPIVDNGITTGAVVAFTDITERKKSFSQIESSLKEKEVLLREIHHRVKNNLQIISSMLNLQTNYITDKKSLAIFEESRNRVRTMALIHEKLYQNESLSTLNIKDYVIELVNNLMRSYRADNRILPEINISDIFINTDTAIPLGLIINELISNSLKYAFPSNEAGRITISLIAFTNEKFQLIISDNGIGLPEEFDIKKTNTLGLQLVNSLVTQLDGEIQVSNNSGTKFEIHFRGLNLRSSKNKPA